MSNIEDPTSNDSTPRLSFSQCLVQPDSPLTPQRPAGSPNANFHFDVAVVDGVSPSADELFSGGRIRPTSLDRPDPDPGPNPDPTPAGEKSTGGKRSLWKFGRSASVNCAGSGTTKVRFLRSYSAGSGPDADPDPRRQPRPGAQPNTRQARARSSKKRNTTGNLPTFPKEGGFIGFLMCNCVGGRHINKGMEYYCSP